MGDEQRDFTQLTGYNGSTLTQLLEDVQKVLSVNIDEESSETLEIISEDFKTLRKIWNKVRRRPTQETISGKTFSGVLQNFYGIFWIFQDFERNVVWHC